MASIVINCHGYDSPRLALFQSVDTSASQIDIDINNLRFNMFSKAPQAACENANHM